MFTDTGWNKFCDLTEDCRYDTVAEKDFIVINKYNGKFLLNKQTGHFRTLRDDEYELLRTTQLPWSKLTEIVFP